MFIILNKLRKFPPTFPAGRSNCRETLHFYKPKTGCADIEKYYIRIGRLSAWEHNSRT